MAFFLSLAASSVAVKVLYLQKMPSEVLDTFKANMEIISKLNHPNLLPIYGICQKPGQYGTIWFGYGVYAERFIIRFFT